MANWLRWTKHGFFTFLKAQFSALVASFVDFTTTILLANLANLYYVYATSSGAVAGGVVNCVVNYRWTFKNGGCKKRFVFIKYTLVWFGSIFLNTYGTFLLTETIKRNPWVQETLSHVFDNIFIVVKIFISVLVCLFWNYHLQRSFVYKDCNIKEFIMRKK